LHPYPSSESGKVDVEMCAVIVVPEIQYLGEEVHQRAVWLDHDIVSL
jgi:hypothetical protein